MKRILTFFFLGCLVGGVCTYLVTGRVDGKEKKLTSSDTVWVKSDSVPSPIVRWLPAERETIYKDRIVEIRDTIKLAFKDFLDSVANMDEDSVEVAKTVVELSRERDTVSLAVVYMGKPFDKFYFKDQWNPDYYKVVSNVIEVPKKKKMFSHGIGLTLGIDARARPNAVLGYGVRFDWP